MTRNDDGLTREQHILLWKTQGGNYSWRKWASMHGLAERNPGFIAEMVAGLAKQGGAK